MVICLERGANLHTAQLMPLPLTVSRFSKIQIGFTFLVPAYLASPGKRPLIGCVCVCVCVFAVCSDKFGAPSDGAVGQLMRRKSDLNTKILHTDSPVLPVNCEKN